MVTSLWVCPASPPAGYYSVTVHLPHLAAALGPCKTPRHDTGSDGGFCRHEQTRAPESRCARGDRGPGGGLAPGQSGDRRRPAGLAGPAPAAGFAARPAAARGHRHDPADRAHRRGDDGEPLLRQPPRHAAPPGCGRVPARPGRAARGRRTRTRTAASSTPSACRPPASYPATRPRTGWPATSSTTTAALDGFVESGSGPVSMGYWQQADLPFYYSLARLFPIADRYFCSVLGQTYPNRRYLMAATSIGQVNDTAPALTDYPANGTIFDRLDAHGITWKDYFTNLATPELFPPLFLKNQGTKIVPIAGFFTDAAAGTLPGFCLVEPEYGTADEENPQNIASGRGVRRAGDQRGDGRPGLGSHAADLDVRRARRVLRPRAAAAGRCRRTPSRPPSPPGSRPTTGSAGTGSGCRARSSLRGPGRATCRTGSSTTRASASWWRPSGTCPR